MLDTQTYGRAVMEEREQPQPRPPAPVAYVPEKPSGLNLWDVPALGPFIRYVFGLIILTSGVLAGLVVIGLLWKAVRLVW